MTLISLTLFEALQLLGQLEALNSFLGQKALCCSNIKALGETSDTVQWLCSAGKKYPAHSKPGVKVIFSISPFSTFGCLVRSPRWS